ncbi:MAG: PKD domain-containing protein [Flavisolibacter sp.]|nr:PKD domain-containing protein [Flavisolibacter sp.]
MLKIIVNFKNTLTIKHYILFLLSVLTISTAFGQEQSTIQFIENKGQWNSSIRYVGEVPGGAFLVHQSGFTVVQHKTDDWEQIQERLHGHTKDGKTFTREQNSVTLRSHAFNVRFLNAAPQPEIIADKPLYTYNNYFIGNDPSKWASECRIYQGITIKDIYPNVDVRYYSNNGTVKYDLILHPGANLSNIALKYEGADKLEIRNKELVIGTSVGELKELNPFSYQYLEKGRKEIEARYTIKDNIVRFDVKGYNPASTLVIDPALIFCSLSGSTEDNWGFTATYGPDGSMYGGGVVFGGGFPVSPGAFQTTYGGGGNPFPVDIGIIKLTPNGQTRAYATYVGGSGSEQPHSLFVDAQGNLVLAGRTNSSNYPTTPGTGNFGPGGGYDIVVTKLNATGTALIGSKRIGGSADDGVNINASRSGPSSLQRNYGDDGRSEVVLDASGNIYVASSTQSGNFPVTGGFQSSNAGGLNNQDGVLLKLTPDVSSFLFSSYIGGSGNDAAYVLSLNPANGDIYVAGGTESTTFNGMATGTISATNNGSIDGFVSIVSNNGATLKRSTFIGTGGIDQVYGIQFDKFNFPYIMGQTTGTFPIINATWSQPGGKQFIAKLQPDLSAYVYATTFGTASSIPNISPVAFLVDRCENVYVSGWGGNLGTYKTLAGTSGLSLVNNILKQSTDGQDFYFFVLKRNATAQLYGDFFGQDGAAPDHVDGGTSRFDASGVIYQAICANCKQYGLTRFPTTPGAWQTTNPTQNGCNLAMVKIAMNLAGVHAAVVPSINGVPRDSAGCVPLKVDFTDTIQNAVSYEWNFGDGSSQITTTSPSTSHTYNSVGNYRVMLVAIDSSTCNIRDTAYVTIAVGDQQALLNFTMQKLNPCDSFRYQFTNSSTAPARPFTNTSFTWDFGDGTPRIRAGSGSIIHSYRTPGTYNVKLILNDSAYCNNPDSLVKQVRVSAIVKAQFEAPKGGCAPYTAQFKNTSLGGQQFLWRFGDGSTANTTDAEHTYTTPGTFTVSLLAIDSSSCNVVDSAKLTITVTDKPTANYSVDPQPPIVNTPITFTNLSSPDAVRFKWLFGDGDSLVTTSREPVQHDYNATGTYNTCLVAYNNIGCADSVCRPVQAIVEVALDVPTAFTPQSGDVNSMVFVRGYGIAKMKFIIWNRWGQKVFESNDRRIGWDGRFKGVLQPMDVYAYTLEVEFADGTRATKKGDITLIR